MPVRSQQTLEWPRCSSRLHSIAGTRLQRVVNGWDRPSRDRHRRRGASGSTSQQDPLCSLGPLALLVFHDPFGVARVRERAECEEDDGKAACAESTRQVAEQLLDHYEAEAGLDRAFDG